MQRITQAAATALVAASPRPAMTPFARYAVHAQPWREGRMAYRNPEL